jgi:hypothetical protein
MAIGALRDRDEPLVRAAGPTPDRGPGIRLPAHAGGAREARLDGDAGAPGLRGEPCLLGRVLVEGAAIEVVPVEAVVMGRAASPVGAARRPPCAAGPGAARGRARRAPAFTGRAGGARGAGPPATAAVLEVRLRVHASGRGAGSAHLLPRRASTPSVRARLPRDAPALAGAAVPFVGLHIHAGARAGVGERGGTPADARQADVVREGADVPAPAAVLPVGERVHARALADGGQRRRAAALAVLADVVRERAGVAAPLLLREAAVEPVRHHVRAEGSAVVRSRWDAAAGPLGAPLARASAAVPARAAVPGIGVEVGAARVLAGAKRRALALADPRRAGPDAAHDPAPAAPPGIGLVGRGIDAHPAAELLPRRTVLARRAADHRAEQRRQGDRDERAGHAARIRRSRPAVRTLGAPTRGRVAASRAGGSGRR